MRQRLSIFVLAFGLALTIGLAVVPSTVIQAAASVADLEKQIAGYERELKQLQTKRSTQQKKFEENLAAQEKAKDVGEKAKLKSEGDKLGRELNQLAKSLKSVREKINDASRKLRKAAQSEVSSAVEAAAEQPNAGKLDGAKRALKAWSKAIDGRSLPTHEEQNLGRRPTASSKRKAEREQVALAEFLKELASESAQLTREEQALSSLSSRNLADGDWVGVKASINSLLKTVKSEAASVRSLIKGGEARKKVLKTHLR